MKFKTSLVCTFEYIIYFCYVIKFVNSVEYSVRVTDYGKVKGVVEYVHGQKIVEKFFGIPYASPPIGNLRLEAPVPPRSWGDSIRNANVLAPACPQASEGVAYIEYHVPGFNKTSEDCLYLNIYVPRGSHHHRSMPVLVFIHGGSYQNGMGAMFDGSVLATHGIVVVTFNYRLGPLGFMNSADGVIRGNYGMLDMIAALQWIQGNIANFNGDPNSVTIDGHSAGGCSVGLLLMSPLAKGLFKRVIQQSGSPLAHWSVSRYETKPNFVYKIFSSSVKCYSNNSAEVKKCIKNLDTETLQRVITEESEWTTSLTPQYRPVVDGYFLPYTPEVMVEREPLNAVHFLTGATQDEGLIAAIPLIKLYGVGTTGFRKLLTLMSCFRGELPEIPDIVYSVLEKYVKFESSDISEQEIERSFSEIVGDYFITAPTHRFADSLSRRNVSVYLYNYEYKSLLDQWDGVIHGAELFYLSGCPFTGHKNFRYDHVDKEMANMLIHIWSNFIKHGIPSLHPLNEIDLPLFNPRRKSYTKIFSSQREPAVSFMTNLRQSKMTFWNQEVSDMYSNRYSKENNLTHKTTYSHVNGKNTWILASVCIGLSVVTLILTVQYFKVRKEITSLLRQNSISSGERMLNGTQI
ncbi:fatty acyl-CoA hydrolase precursor, medium chain-like [Ruditapes philippinarum]|uniref:fatty acyl-CoA hydrolase precursor, medium chain-like n=1 Tax=Ruditapes philippinarum TaxID=129788 RepID=UPI00295A6A35|nr:fatty acyl-CoA hydrolase precursor, medium chain-like [Ruditapes philippinarum]